MSYYGIVVLHIYFATLISLYIYRFFNQKIGTYIAYAVSFFAFITAGLRPDHFPDVDTYELMFEFASSGEFNDPSYWLAHGEPGFKIFSFAFSIISVDYRLYLLTIAFLSYILFIFASRVARVKFVYVWFFYLSTFFVTRDLGVIRLSIASHLIVIALSQEKKLSSLLTLTLSSLSFQYYSIVSVLSIVISKFKINNIRFVLVFVVTFVLAPYINLDLISIFALEKQLDNYNLSGFDSPGLQSVMVPILRNLLFFIIVLLLFKRVNIERIQKIWIISIFFSVVAYIFFYNYTILAQRLSAYFGAVLPFALAWTFDKENLRSHSKFYFVTLFSVINFIGLFYFNDFVWLNW